LRVTLLALHSLDASVLFLRLPGERLDGGERYRSVIARSRE
jgi:hypothetical protein